MREASKVPGSHDGDRATAQLDNWQLERALAVVERETPTRRQSWWFRWLQRAVWSALLLSATWAATSRFFGLRRAYPLLLLAVACYVALLPLLAMNLGMIRKLARAARVRRTLRLAARLAPHFREGRRRHRVYNSLTLAMSGLGYVCVATALLLFFLELPDFDTTGLAITVLVLAWGLGGIALHYMARGAERLRVISQLRATLLAGKESLPEGSTDGLVVAAEQYDALSRLEHAQIQSDRRRCIAAGLQKPSDGYALRLSSNFREAERALSGDAQGDLHHTLRTLAQDPSGAPAGPQQFWLPVPGTPIEVFCHVDHESREVRVYTVRETAVPFIGQPV